MTIAHIGNDGNGVAETDIRTKLNETIDAVNSGGGGGSISVTDGTHTVAAATKIKFTSGATVSDAGGGEADVAIAGGGGGDLVLIAEHVTAASQASVDFASIPATYRDLEVRVCGRALAAATVVAVSLQFNGDTGTNYDDFTFQYHQAGGGTVEHMDATSAFAGYIVGASGPADFADSVRADIFNYTDTNWFKSMQNQSGPHVAAGTSGLYTQIGTMAWKSKVAINELTVLCIGGFVDGTVVSVYGRK